MKTRTIYMILIALTLVSIPIDFLFSHPHHHEWYHELLGFEIVFGIVGAFGLMGFSIWLSGPILWKTTCSILLEPELAGFGTESARLIKWLVDDGDKVKSGQPLVKFETDRGIGFTIDAPHDGKVSKCFIEEMDFARVGESVVDLTVSRHAMGHGKEAKHA